MTSSSSCDIRSVDSMAILPDNFNIAKSSVTKTAEMLANIESIIEEMKQLRDEFLPERCAILTREIRINKRSANLLILTAHVSLRDKIAYEQQKRAVIRQKGILAQIEGQKAKWTTALKMAKEQKHQLKRLQKVQQEYAITSHMSDCDEEHKLGLEKRITVAMDRCLRAQRTYSEIVKQVKADTDRMTEDSEWYRKQDELDEKAKMRAREAAKNQRETKPKPKGESWGPTKCKDHVRKSKGQEPKTKKQGRC